MIAYAKAHPGKLTLGVPNGAPPHMLAVWFKSLTATDILVVPYKGAANEMTDLIGGQIDLGIETDLGRAARISPTARMRALATTTAERLPETAERADDDRERRHRFCRRILDRPCRRRPARRRPIVDKLNAAVNAGLARRTCRAKLKASAPRDSPARLRISPPSSPRKCRNGRRWRNCPASTPISGRRRSQSLRQSLCQVIEPERFDDRRPSGELGLHCLGKVLRRAADRLVAEIGSARIAARGDFSPSLIVALSLAMIGAGVCAGANKPVQAVVTKPG